MSMRQDLPVLPRAAETTAPMCVSPEGWIDHTGSGHGALSPSEISGFMQPACYLVVEVAEVV